MMQAEADVTPFLHAPLAVQSAIGSGDLGSRVLKETIAGLASESMWRQLWLVADSLSREVSVLPRQGRKDMGGHRDGRTSQAQPAGRCYHTILALDTHTSVGRTGAQPTSPPSPPTPGYWTERWSSVTTT